MNHSFEPGFYISQRVCRVVDGVEQPPEHEAYVYPRGTAKAQPGLLPSYKTHEEAESARDIVTSEAPGLYTRREGDKFFRVLEIVHLCDHTPSTVRCEA